MKTDGEQETCSTNEPLPQEAQTVSSEADGTDSLKAVSDVESKPNDGLNVVPEAVATEKPSDAVGMDVKGVLTTESVFVRRKPQTSGYKGCPHRRFKAISKQMDLNVIVILEVCRSCGKPRETRYNRQRNNQRVFTSCSHHWIREEYEI